MQYGFGSGKLVAVRSGVNNPTPRDLAVLQETSVDFSFNVKELMGNKQFPVAAARGAGKISCKSKFAAFSASAINDLFFDGTTATGETRVSQDEPAQPATNTITVANGATFQEDLGVFNRVTGRFMERVASAPATGQYSVNTTTGQYTFAAADSNPACYISYRYSVASGPGRIITINNSLLGVQPTFSVVLNTQFTHADGVTRQMTLRLNSCMSSKFSLATKQEDFILPDFEFQAFADQTGTVGSLSLAE